MRAYRLSWPRRPETGGNFHEMAGSCRFCAGLRPFGLATALCRAAQSRLEWLRCWAGLWAKPSSNAPETDRLAYLSNRGLRAFHEDLATSSSGGGGEYECGVSWVTRIPRPQLTVPLILALVTAWASSKADAAQASGPAVAQERSDTAPENLAAQPTSDRPSQDELDRADTEPSDWLTYNKGYLGYRFSKLDEINASNVRDLKVICTFKLGERGSFQNGPIEYDGTLYTTSALATFAIDAATCERRWQHQYSPGYVPVANNKGAAIAGGRVIRGTPDGHLIALDAKTGALLWDRQIMDPTNGEFATAAPLVWKDLVFIGKAGADFGIRGEMMAFRAFDGAKVWGFYVVPGHGEVGSDTWENPASVEHGGGSTWTSYSLDPAAGLLMIPVGNPAPDFAKEMRPGANLFTDSIVALDAATGQLRWWRQLVAADDRDWDTSVVAAFDVADGGKLAAAAGKDGVLHVVDRADGRLRFTAPLVSRYLNAMTAVTGGAGIRLCPTAAVQWNGPAYSPNANLIYMNGIDWCAQVIKGPTPTYVKGQSYLGWANAFGTRDPLDQAFGLVNAIDPATGQLKWRYRTSALPLGAVTATAGGFVMTGETNGDFVVLADATGEELYKANLGGAIGGGIITYEASGKQFVAVSAGHNANYFGAQGDNEIVVLGMP
jgi:alcohol dehydrogenase (cytochrome c)